MAGELVPKRRSDITTASTSPAVPAIVASRGERGALRFLEFFAANIRNPHTRRAYFRATVRFLRWCEDTWGLRDLTDVQPMHVATFLEERLVQVDKPSVKQELAAIRMLFDWLVVGQ